MHSTVPAFLYKQEKNMHFLYLFIVSLF